MAIAAPTPAALGSARNTSTPKARPDGDGDDLARAPARQGAAAFAGSEAVARHPVGAHDSAPLARRPDGGQPPDLRAVTVVAQAVAHLARLDRVDQPVPGRDALRLPRITGRGGSRRRREGPGHRDMAQRRAGRGVVRAGPRRSPSVAEGRMGFGPLGGGTAPRAIASS